MNNFLLKNLQGCWQTLTYNRTGKFIPICIKYGPLPALISGLAIPIASGMASLLFAAISSHNGQAGYIAAANLGSGTAAHLLSQYVIETRTANWLRKRNIGIKKGSKILQRAQMAGGAVVIGLTVAVPGWVYHQMPEQRKMEIKSLLRISANAAIAQRPKFIFSNETPLKAYSRT